VIRLQTQSSLRVAHVSRKLVASSHSVRRVEYRFSGGVEASEMSRLQPLR